MGKEIFEEHGRNWMKRTLQLGEEHPDRTYEVLKAAAARTGALTFPHVPQRFIEIAYLSTHGMSGLPIVENNARRLVYKLIRCKTFDALKERCGEEVANLLPCRHACLAALETLFEDLNMGVKLDMEASLIQEGYCQFAAQKI